MAKYRLLRQKLLTDDLSATCQMLIPAAASNDQLLRVHSERYLSRVIAGQLTDHEVRRIGFPWSSNMVERSRRSVGATICAVASALADPCGVSVNLAGGTHHAFRDHGQGYCVFNDVAVAIREAKSTSLALRVLVIDADVHQGNGTAEIFQSDDSVFTFSIHSAKSFPARKTVGDIEIALASGTGDETYLAELQSGLDACPKGFDLAVYLAGADPYEGDRLGRLKVTKAGLRQRDQLVLSHCKRQGLPVAITMAGGYAPDIDDIVGIQFSTIQTAARVYGLMDSP
ncbi:UNVERIFIED_CONTAM: hypothetical protein GTU68_040227 [Idotea baltica]|nr:hypothetical protein [Idotea baltica]